MFFLHALHAEPTPLMLTDIQLLHGDQADQLQFDWGALTFFAGRRLGNSAEMTIGRCLLKPGASNPRHYHPNCEEILVVMQGRIIHTAAGGGEVEMNEGDTVTIPRNIWHCARNIGENDALLFIAFSSADRQTIGEEAAFIPSHQ
jgi:quercetin dioxygenase-like cupin family protein